MSEEGAIQLWHCLNFRVYLFVVRMNDNSEMEIFVKEFGNEIEENTHIHEIDKIREKKEYKEHKFGIQGLEPEGKSDPKVRPSAPTPPGGAGRH